MERQQQQKVLAKRRLLLPRERLIKHYLDCYIILGISLFGLIYSAKVFPRNQIHFYSPYLLLLTFFPLLTILAFFNKWQELNLKELSTDATKNDNYKAVKDTLKELGWHIKVDNKGFIEAYTDNFGFWTWTDQMISIIIVDDRIMFNSIGNVDSYATQIFSWGQNIRNKRKFWKTFNLFIHKELI